MQRDSLVILRSWKMTLNKLTLKNFKRYREKEFEFGFGLTGIIGKNGAGKSTIFEAIIFALYGESRQNKESLKYSKAEPKEELLVTLYFSMNEKEYRIERSLRGKALTAKAELYCASEHIASSVKGVNATVTKLIGMNKEAFINTVFASQKELTALSQLKSDERKKIIRKLLGLERVDLIEKRIFSERADLNREIKVFKEHLFSDEESALLKKGIDESCSELRRVEGELERLETEFIDCQKSLEELETRSKEVQKLKEDYKSIESNIALLQSKKEQLTKALTRVKNDLQKRQESKHYYQENIGVLKEYTELKSALVKLQKNKELQIKKEGLEKEQVQLRKQLKQIGGEIKEFKILLQKSPELELKRVKYSDAQSKYNQWLNELQKRVKLLEAQKTKAQTLIESSKKQLAGITKLGKEASCPTCTRALLDEYDSVVANLSATIETISKRDLESASNELTELLKKRSEAESKLEKIEKVLKQIEQEQKVLKSKEESLIKKQQLYIQIKESGLSNKEELKRLENLNYDEKEHITLLKNFDKVEKLYSKLIALKPLIDELPALSTQKESFEKELQNLEKDKELSESKLKKHNYSTKEEQALAVKVKEAHLLKDSLNKQKQQKLVERANLNAVIKSNKEKLESNSKKEKQLQNKILERDDLERLKAYLASFKSAINSKVTPRISQIASDLFFEITHGRYQYIEVDEAFDFYIYDEGKRHPLERFSGGEIDLANLVLRIAISKTLNELNTNNSIEFLAFDEVFGSQDEERRYAIMDSFNKISQHYREIFLISHEREIKEMFESVIELV